MNLRPYILAVITGLFVLFNFSCAGKDNSFRGTEIVLDDGYKTAKSGEVLIDDAALQQASQPAGARGARQENPVTLKDNSVLTVMYDGFGNKVETREFPGDSRLLTVTVATSVKGKQEITVRGRNTEVRDLPPEMINKVLTASSNEIADAAQIYQRQILQKELPAVVTELPPTRVLTPLPAQQSLPPEAVTAPQAAETENQTAEVPKQKPEVRETAPDETKNKAEMLRREVNQPTFGKSNKKSPE